MKKIELNILLITIFEALYLLFFFKCSFINIILGIILGIILIKLFKNVKKNNIIKILLLIISIPLFILILYNIVVFITYNILKNYSIIPIYLSLIIISFYISKDYHIFIKVVELLFYLILLIKIIILLLSIPLININNLYLDLNINYMFIIISLMILLIYNYFYYLSDHRVSNKEIIISFINPSIIKLLTIFIIGNPLINIYKYPYINSLKKIKYLNFIERMDGILSFEYLFCFIVLLSYILLIIKGKRKSQ